MSEIKRLIEAGAPLLVAAAQRRAANLFRQAHDVYQSANSGPSVELFGEARALAESIDDRAMAMCARFWEGAALHGMGRLHEALAAFAPAAATDVEPGEHRWVYMAITRCILIALELPLSLDIIERALDEGWERFAVDGPDGQRSRLLLARARLALARGRYGEALAEAQEGLERRRRETLSYSYSTHMRTLVDICFRLGDLDLAQRYVEEWERAETEYPTTKRISLAAARSLILRREGRIEQAVDWARRAAHEGRQSDDLPSSFWVRKTLVRALLCTEDPDSARGPLFELLRLRHSEVGKIRYETRLLLADYHHATARQLAGLPPLDFDAGLDFDGLHRLTQRRGVAQQLGGARRFYGLAFEAGRAIDQLLECDVRTREIEDRLRRVDAISDLFEERGEAR